jgi:hypothetical protein
MLLRGQSMRNKWSIGAVLVGVLSGCGGGGSPESGGTGNSNPLMAATTYQAVATAGELISYTVDTTALTYSYRVVESAYGKTGATGAGTLTRNLDGTYTPSGFQGKVAVLENGLLMGQIYEDMNNDGLKDIVPVIGISNPIPSLTDAAGIYNFISNQCNNLFCEAAYGTVKVNSNGTWITCTGGNLAATTYNCQASASGSISSFSDGRARLLYNGAIAGSLLIFRDSSSGQKVILLDLNGATALGRGGVFAATQSLPSSADGNWHYAHSNGSIGIANVSGQNVTDIGRYRNGTPYGPISGSFSTNQPWSGLLITGNGGVLMPAGSGLYAGYFGANGVSIGVRK